MNKQKRMYETNYDWDTIANKYAKKHGIKFKDEEASDCPVCYLSYPATRKIKGQGKNLCLACHKSWYGETQQQAAFSGSVSVLKNYGGDIYKYEVASHSYGGITLIVTNAAINVADDYAYVSDLKRQGINSITLFSGAHGDDSPGINGFGIVGAQCHSFYDEDVRCLKEFGIKVKKIGHDVCPKADTSVVIFAWCFSNTTGDEECPKCYGYFITNVKGKGKKMCIFPNCGWSGY